MNKIENFIALDDLNFINLNEKEWLNSVFDRFDDFPTLEQLWLLMDEVWVELDCDQKIIDERIDQYYSHPVWLLNGLFAEQHKQSLENRRGFTEWIENQKLNRIADIGGGFGTLARMIGKRCNGTEVDIIEPYPHKLAIERTKDFNNVQYKDKLEGKYDLLIATDLFEHVEDPLELVAETASSLEINGIYLIANCFQPVILCHLPQCFHFRYTWDKVLKAMGFKIKNKILYGTIFVAQKKLDLGAARRIELRSQKLWSFTCNLHRYIQRPLAKILI